MRQPALRTHPARPPISASDILSWLRGVPGRQTPMHQEEWSAAQELVDQGRAFWQGMPFNGSQWRVLRLF